MLRLAYISFDQVPASKGASTHIETFVRGLAAEFGAIDLVTVATHEELKGPTERWPGVRHWEIPALGSSLIERVLHFNRLLTGWLEPREYDAIQFRSNFEGMPIVKYRKGAALVFEVNGLPSIELKYRYPGCEDDRELMRKLVAQERICVSAADCLVTPSAVTRDYLVSARGAVAGKISVIPNGADIEVFRATPLPVEGEVYELLYFGTLASWQGVEIAIRAVAQVEDTGLTILGTGTNTRKRALLQLADKLGVGARVRIEPPVGQGELADYLTRCGAVVAPLLWNDRNVVQGCCPLKVLEGMAAARPVIATDLAVVRDLGIHEEHFLLTGPGLVTEMSSAIRRLRRDRALANRLATNARSQVEERFTWKRQVAELVDLYRAMLTGRASTEDVSDVPVPVRN